MTTAVVILAALALMTAAAIVLLRIRQRSDARPPTIQDPVPTPHANEPVDVTDDQPPLEAMSPVEAPDESSRESESDAAGTHTSEEDIADSRSTDTHVDSTPQINDTAIVVRPTSEDVAASAAVVVESSVEPRSAQHVEEAVPHADEDLTREQQPLLDPTTRTSPADSPDLDSASEVDDPDQEAARVLEPGQPVHAAAADVSSRSPTDAPSAASSEEAALTPVVGAATSEAGECSPRECNETGQGGDNVAADPDAPVSNDLEDPPMSSDAPVASAVPAPPPAASKDDSRTQPQPRQYRGLTRPKPRGKRNDTPSDRAAVNTPPSRRSRALPIEVRLRFDRGGFCAVSLVAKRTTELPETLTVSTASGELDLCGMQEEWYQDVFPEDMPSTLHDGVVWTTDEYNWSLSGRDLFVLASRADISGYVSQPCLALGREHVVLCSETIREAVEMALAATGADPSVVIDASLGTPPGWIAYQRVVPTVSVHPVDGPDLLNALRPLPEIELSLEGGVPLAYASWIEGHPPAIRVYGDPEHAVEVYIDGALAHCGSDREYQSPGWDVVGSHSVVCAGRTRSYSIVPFDGSWSWWDAYSFAANGHTSRRLSVCGPIVRADFSGQGPAVRTVTVPETNPILVGAAPGQHALGIQASTVIGAKCVASPGFSPVWALPSNPLHCSKITACIRLLTHIAPQLLSADDFRAVRRARDSAIDSWCQIILNSSRKGLRLEPDTQSARYLWSSYTRLARRIWRSRK